MRSTLFVRAVLAVAVAATGVAVLGAPAGADPVVTVTPSTNLRDGQIIEVSGTGFVPGATVGIIQCGTQGSVVSCRTLASGLTVDGAGNVSAPIVAHAVVRGLSFGLGSPQAADVPCQPSCRVAIGSGSTYAPATISFDPGAPLVVPSITIDPLSGLGPGIVATASVGPGWFDLGQSVTLAQCIPPLTSLRYMTCGANAVAGTASTTDGSFSGQITLAATVESDPPTDCAVGGCVVAVGSDRQDLVTTPLTFTRVSIPSTTSTTRPRGVVTTPRFTG